MTNGQEQTTTPTFDELWNSDGKPSPAEPSQTKAPEQEGGPAAKGTAPIGKEGDAGQQAAATGGAEGEQGSSGQPDDWLAGAGIDPAIAERIRAERRQAEDRFKALHERVAPLQRTLDSLQRQQRQPQQTQAPAQPATGSAAPTDSFFESDKWKRWAEDYPGDAEIMRTAFEQSQRESTTKVQTLEQRLAGLEGKLGSVAQVTSDIEHNRQIAALTQAHPDWEQINVSDEFWLWFDGYRATQPAEVRGAWYDPPTLDKWFNNAEFLTNTIAAYKREAPAPGATSETTTTASEPVKPQQDVRLRMSEAPVVKGGQRPPATVPLESMTPAEQFHHLWNAANKPS